MKVDATADATEMVGVVAHNLMPLHLSMNSSGNFHSILLKSTLSPRTTFIP
jgi:hypothetical protein